MKKPVSLPPGTPAVHPTQGLLAKAPSLFAFLTDPLWEDGTARDLGTLLVFFDAGRWKACLSDRALDRVCFTSGDDLESLIRSIEKDLGADRCDWRAAKHGGGKKH